MKQIIEIKIERELNDEECAIYRNMTENEIKEMEISMKKPTINHFINEDVPEEAIKVFEIKVVE